LTAYIAGIIIVRAKKFCKPAFTLHIWNNSII
jgi:hypothetical protein